MIKRIGLLILIALACRLPTLVTVQGEPSPTAPPVLTNPAALPTDSGTSATPGVSPTSAPPATYTPSPPEPVAFYHLRLEFSTTSDWTTLEIKNPEDILSLREISIQGQPTHSLAAPARLELNQPLQAAENGQSVGITVDYAVSSQASTGALILRVQKGAWNASKVRLSRVIGADLELIKEVNHNVALPSDPELNAVEFTIDLSPLNSVPPEQAQIEHIPQRKMLWAFYYPWYFGEDWPSPRLKDHPVPRYASADSQAMRRQIEGAQSAGIDGFISSWWGPGHFTDQNFSQLLDLAEESGFWVTVYFETLDDGKPRAEAQITEWLGYLIRTYRDRPAFMKVDGLPLIVLYSSEAVPLETWQSIFANLAGEGLDARYLGMSYDVSNLTAFAGLHQYSIFDLPDLAQTDLQVGKAVRYFPLLSDSASPKIWAATVQPGYDDRLIPDRQGLFQDRLGGDFYRSTFEAALASDPDWILITTWNEWWENTAIEPGELYGDQYLQITKEFAEKWKSQ